MRIKPKKSLGQNFLVDNNIRNKIIDSLELKSSDFLLEIGPGRGELTSLISSRVNKVYALEIDNRLVKFLSDSLKPKGNISVIHADILKFDLKEFIDKEKIPGKLKIFGNIPYYISSPIIEYLIKERSLISSIFITVQKEFARRVISLPGSKDYGSFSCFAQYYLEPRVMFDISRNSFYPKPKVDSSFLRLDARSRPAVAVDNEERFFKIIRSAFNQRRKTLRNSLNGVITQAQLDKFFEKSGFNPNVRPERLSLADFAYLANL
jgi:16S rRNA (adenine1518-N6/adenine1519-N6)-dimethyltransferase